ncbi:MAG: TerC family protein [Phycisphaerae bacterium]
MQIWFWIGFVVLVLGVLALDLGVLSRGAKVITTKAALAFSGFCVALALAFGVLIYFMYEGNWFDIAMGSGKRLSGAEAATQYITAWIIEQSLSLDNIFVIALIFGYFAVPREHQHRTLFWGIVGALVMRCIMILAGAILIKQFHWIIYVFGGILLWTAYKMWRGTDEKLEPERNPLVKLAKSYFPISPGFVKEQFFTRLDGRLHATPMFLVLLVIESTDLIFAVDSIPAVFAVTKDPFIVFTSNVFAILNLRSLYFALAEMLERFHYLKPSLVIILAYVGVKMLLSEVFPIPTGVSLAVIALTLAGGVVLSLILTKPHAPADASKAA